MTAAINTETPRYNVSISLPTAATAATERSRRTVGTNNIAFHAADLADALDPPNSIAHALDLHEDIDGTRNLRAQRSQRQIRRRHQDHVFEPEQRITGRVRVDRAHRSIMASIHRLQHVESFTSSHLADDYAIGPSG